ncbi:MAG: DUF790 family protein, partial [Methanomassiliicoccales archaeon]|nr:DUF790 family protein [Methanomassiliicoccales archaeon]
ASISRKTFKGKRIYEFSLDHTKRSIFGPDSEPAEVGFDSAIEKEFYQLSFNDWTVRREPAVLKAGEYAFIPDFSLERNGARIYVEIVGFWTPEYLKHKIQKFNQLKEKESMILLVNRTLACTGTEFQSDNLIFYDRKIPYLDIIKILRRYEEEQQAEDIAKLKDKEISLGSDTGVVNLDEVADRYGVSLEALKEVIRDKNMPDYSLVCDQLVSIEVLGAIRAELAGVTKHGDAVQIFKNHGVDAHSVALSLLGYKVKWTGLDPENAEIVEDAT